MKVIVAQPKGARLILRGESSWFLCPPGSESRYKAMCGQCPIPALVPVLLSCSSALEKPCSSAYVTVSAESPESSPALEGFILNSRCGGSFIVRSPTQIPEREGVGGGEAWCSGSARVSSSAGACEELVV